MNSKWISSLNVRPKTLKLLGEEVECPTKYVQRQALSKQDSICSGNKANNWQIGPHEIKMFYSTKVTETVNKEAAYRTGKNLHQLYISQNINIQTIQRTQENKYHEAQKGSEQSAQKK